jgi:hypothetical protein
MQLGLKVKRNSPEVESGVSSWCGCHCKGSATNAVCDTLLDSCADEQGHQGVMELFIAALNSGG